jgi:pyrroloquinoline quinone biosynthesis protein D
MNSGEGKAMGTSERYRRRPGLPWREEADAARDALAALEAGSDAGGEGTLLIVERGRITELNLLGGEIWKLCDGSRDVAAIVEELLPRFEVEREELARDVAEFLADLLARGWLVPA